MTFRVRIKQDLTFVEVGEGQTILSAALAADVPYPHSCQMGRCGACKSRLLSGQVELLPYSRFALDADERAQGLILACRSVPQSNLEIAWGIEDTSAPSSVMAKVLAKHEVAPQIVRLLVEASNGVPFKPGQYFSVRFDGAPRRNLSPASQPDQKLVEFHVRIVPDGTFGNYLVNKVELGAPVQLAGPFGDAYLREHAAEPIVAAAAGSGLAPIKSIVDRALALDPLRSISVFVSARSASALYLSEYFENLWARHPGVRYRTVLTRDGVRPRRLPDLLLQGSRRFDGHHVHIAGPPGFVESTRQALRSLGAAESTTFADPFAHQISEPLAPTDATFEKIPQ